MLVGVEVLMILFNLLFLVLFSIILPLFYLSMLIYYYRPGHVEIRWVPDNSGMRVGEKQADKKDMDVLDKMERMSKEDVEVGSMQNMDEVEVKDEVEATSKKLELDREDL